MRPRNHLTPQQKRFVDAVLCGNSGAEAVRVAGSSGSGATRAKIACDYMKIPHVRAAIDEGKQAAAAAFSWSRDEMLATLKGIASGAEHDADRVRAIVQASKMLGTDAPVKTEISGGLVVRWEE